MELIKDLHQRGISKVYVVEQVRFNGEDAPKYIEIFNELRSEGYIIAPSYGDIAWKLPCFTTNQFFNLRFDLEVYRELNQALRMYSVALIMKGKSSPFIWSRIDYIKKLIVVTSGFSNPERLEEHLLDPSNSKAYDMARTVLNFIEFYPVEKSVQFHEICQKFSESERKRRELPPFMDILIFDDVVNDYFRQARSDEELLSYKPIQLWWALTNIIPMRPNEFLRLRNDCAERAADGTLWITIPRSKKVKQSVRDIPPTQTFQISKEIYDLIQEFQFILTKNKMESEYLLPQQYYETFSSGKSGRNSIIVENRWKLKQFAKLLKSFHKQVISELYHEANFELLPSHTRHLAIINLFLQGFNMLTIANMAGHAEINQPSHYYSHAENFVQSYVYNLVRSGISNNIGRRFTDGFIGWRRAAIDRGKMYSFEEAQYQFRPVDYGFCRDDDFPNNCGEDCRPCPYFIFKPSVNDHERALQWLEDYSALLHQKASDVIYSMIATSKAISSAVRPDLDESLRAKSRQLQQLMDHSAFIELLKMEEMSNE